MLLYGGFWVQFRAETHTQGMHWIWLQMCIWQPQTRNAAHITKVLPKTVLFEVSFSNLIKIVFIKIVFIIYSKLWTPVTQNCEVLTVRIVNIVWPKLWIFVGQNCGYLLIKCEYMLIKIVYFFLETRYCFNMIIIYTVRVLTIITIICIIYVSK